jgi:hypothetical protein
VNHGFFFIALFAVHSVSSPQLTSDMSDSRRDEGLSEDHAFELPTGIERKSAAAVRLHGLVGLVERSRYAAGESKFRASQILAHWCFPQVTISGCLLTAGQQTGWLCDQPTITVLCI